MKRSRRIALLVGIALLLGLVALAIARPGGGESYSGGGGHYSGGSSGGSSGSDDDGWWVVELVIQLIRLCIYYPKIGIPIVLGIIGLYAFSAIKKRMNRDWDSGPPVQLQRAQSIQSITQLDPDFSQPAFEDFVYHLYAAVHLAKLDPIRLAGLGPYLSDAARAQLPKGVTEPTKAVVIGAMRVTRIVFPTEREACVKVDIEFEANHAEDKDTKFVVENWTLSRGKDERTKPPKASNYFPCPNCGAPWSAAKDRFEACASCGNVPSFFSVWTLDAFWIRSSQSKGPTLTTEVPERGTDLPTYHSELVGIGWMDVRTQGGVTEQAFLQRTTMIYDQLNKAWAANDLAVARGVVTDGIYDYLRYWIDAYKQQGLRNELKDMRITRTDIAKVTRDKYYDAVTVRIWGTGKDYVVRIADNALVRGSKNRERAYSEYWTLIRSAGRKGDAKTTPICGNCGAALQIEQSGECTHCGAHVTAGEFDWVLSKIEQDDSYRG